MFVLNFFFFFFNTKPMKLVLITTSTSTSTINYLYIHSWIFVILISDVVAKNLQEKSQKKIKTPAQNKQNREKNLIYLFLIFYSHLYLAVMLLTISTFVFKFLVKKISLILTWKHVSFGLFFCACIRCV